MRLLLAILLSVLASVPASAQEAKPPIDQAQAKELESVKATLAEVRTELASMQRALVQLVQQGQGKADLPKAYQDAVRAQAERCGAKGFRYVAVGVVDGKDAALCIADVPKGRAR